MAVGSPQERQLRKLGAVKLPFGMGWVSPQFVLPALLDALESAAVADAIRGRRFARRSSHTMKVRAAILNYAAKELRRG